MKKVMQHIFATVFLAVTGIASNAYAGLIMDIEDNGFGTAQFTLSGSDVVTGGGYSTNGIWLYDQNLLGTFLSNTSTGTFSVTSGSATIGTTTSGTRNVFDVYIMPGGNCCDFGIRSGSGMLSVGDTVSWSGSFTTALTMSAFNDGVFFFDHLAAHPYDSTYLQDGLTVRVNAESVPEPAAIALLALGLTGLGFARRTVGKS